MAQIKKENPRIDYKYGSVDESGKKKRVKTESKPPRSEKEATQILDLMWEKNPILALTAELQSELGMNGIRDY